MGPFLGLTRFDSVSCCSRIRILKRFYPLNFILKGKLEKVLKEELEQIGNLIFVDVVST